MIFLNGIIYLPGALCHCIQRYDLLLIIMIKKKLVKYWSVIYNQILQFAKKIQWRKYINVSLADGHHAPESPRETRGTKNIADFFT